MSESESHNKKQKRQVWLRLKEED